MPYINVYIKSFDGLRLYGALLESEKFSDKIIICVHGFTGSGKKDFASLARTYYLNGYNVLLVDNRAHGQSEGKYVGFGVLDRLDLRNWVKYTVNRFGSNIKIFLHGISMGGATVLMASSIMPKNVRGIIADCGFTSVDEIFEYVLKRDYHLRDSLSFILQILCQKFVPDTDIKMLIPLRKLQNRIFLFYLSTEKMTNLYRFG